MTRTNTVVMSNKELVWDNPDTHSAMLDRSPCGSGETFMQWSFVEPSLEVLADLKTQKKRPVLSEPQEDIRL